MVLGAWLSFRLLGDGGDSRDTPEECLELICTELGTEADSTLVDGKGFSKP
jgi:hypothetical protein